MIYESMHGAGAVVAAQRGIPAVEHAVVWAAPRVRWPPRSVLP